MMIYVVLQCLCLNVRIWAFEGKQPRHGIDLFAMLIFIDLIASFFFCFCNNLFGELFCVDFVVD